ncbi:MAG: hypothetical protein HGA37_03045 [Lentimicrobium sp.]|nr:hypothetical protein [Lentimicrobium sp.]
MSIKLVSVGDFMTGENVHHYHRGIISRFKGRYTDLISDSVKGIMQEADILLLNFEVSLMPDEEISKLDIKRGVYVAPLESLKLLKELNSTIIANVANNHFGQHGLSSVSYTIDKLNENGISVIGANNKPLILKSGAYSLSIWGVSLVKDNHFEGGYFKSNYNTLIDDLNLPEKKSDEIRIISIHWGEEYFTIENKAQRILAEKLSHAGFDIISGHHPHVVQPFRTIGKTKVIFSHGNFIFDQNFSRLTQKGLVSQIQIPEGNLKLYLSQQKEFRLVNLQEIDLDGIERFCTENFHKKKPLLMRIRMKLELLLHFYELNSSIIRTFTSKLFKA